SSGSRCTRTSYIERSIVSGFRPWLIVRLPCGSRSTVSTFDPCSASATARLSVEVVFATPPFWLANAMTRAMASFWGSSPTAGSRSACKRPMLGLSSSHVTRVLRRHPAPLGGGHRAPAALERALGHAAGACWLRTQPRLRLPEERAHLDEQVAGRRARPLQPLDALESRQHGPRLVHGSTVADRPPRRCDGFVSRVCRGAPPLDGPCAAVPASRQLASASTAK